MRVSVDVGLLETPTDLRHNNISLERFGVCKALERLSDFGFIQCERRSNAGNYVVTAREHTCCRMGLATSCRYMNGICVVQHSNRTWPGPSSH